MKAKLWKLDNSSVVRIPRSIAQKVGLRPGDALTIEVREGRIVLVPPGKTGPIPYYRLEDLLKGVTRRTRHAEIDFGPPVGREVW
ncbi:MAG: AbrB/MazE/SpoVT family DNA-binding domain-containing protein [Gammaproteobacteria bacterium]|nr:AbrB/MazE/SpoVT family DNA-binding domain-containing protein [Gammaproteobacteria bacterium]